ncbi:MAG: ABC transporter permease [Deltaproteobacteria bacterium]|nr:ABC transporter permease [Deltaproteobacteria bacterium]
MGTLLGDLRYALRTLIRTPVLSLAAILTMALGVGVTTHTFSTVYGGVMRPLDIDGDTRLISISQTIPADGITGGQIPILDLVDWRESQTAFHGLAAFRWRTVNLADDESLAAFRWRTVNLADDESRPERFSAAMVSANLFSEVLATPELGRTFTVEEELSPTPTAIILSHEVWQNRYEGDPDIIGRTVRANAISVTVVGVMPEGFHFPFDQRVWLPMGINPLEAERGAETVQVVGRLNAGVTMDQARVQMEAIVGRLAEEYAETNAGRGVWVQPYEDFIMPPAIVAVLWIMLASVFGVLLIACFNVANLLLARALSRSKEVAIRSALGASRGQVIRQLLMEAVILAMVGGAVGIAMAYGMQRGYDRLFVDIQKPYWIIMTINTPTLLFALGVTGMAALVSGIFPALKASGADVHEILKDESRGSTGLRMGRFSSFLVIGEIALSCGLLVGAGMMVKSVVNLRTMDMGFDGGPVMTARFGLPATDYPDRVTRQQFFDDLLDGLRALPGVESASLASSLPALGSGRAWYGVEGVAYQTDQDYPSANVAYVMPDFFETFGVGLLEGRSFTGQDRDGALLTTVVNQSFAERHFGEESALGRRFRLGRLESEEPYLTIIGVVPDLHVGGGVGGLGSDAVSPEQFYRSIPQNAISSASMAVRARGDPIALTPSIRSLVQELDPNLPLYQVGTMGEAIETTTWAFGLFGSIFVIFGLASLFLAGVGLYGVMAFSVGRRTQEMGVRMALGATGRQIMGLVLGGGMKQLGIGGAIGLGMGAIMAQQLTVVFFDVNPMEPSVFAAIVVTLGVAGIAACIVPALRATRVELVDALRPE